MLKKVDKSKFFLSIYINFAFIEISLAFALIENS